jgi:hypothetical protein
LGAVPRPLLEQEWRRGLAVSISDFYPVFTPWRLCGASAIQ